MQIIVPPISLDPPRARGASFLFLPFFFFFLSSFFFFKPVRAGLELVQHGPVDKLKHEMQLALAPKDLLQVHQVPVLELLRSATRRERGE